MLRVLIAHSSEVYANCLKRRLKDICQIRICQDGRQTLAELSRFQPDLFVLHSAMPRMDSLTILRRSTYAPRVVLLCTDLQNAKLLRITQALGVEQVLLMPLVRAVDAQIRDTLEGLRTGTQPPSLEYRTAFHLQTLGIPVHRDGYRQLRIAVPLLCRQPRMPLSKALYPAIAEALDVSDHRAVEHSIRQAIVSAWQSRQAEDWLLYFPAEQFPTEQCPSNKQFLTRLAQLVQAD